MRLERDKIIKECSFNDLFSPIKIEWNCSNEQCKNTRLTKSYEFVIPRTCHYILVILTKYDRIPPRGRFFELNTKIKNFNPDFVQIPNCNETFQCVSAVCHTTSMLGGDPRKSGHYTCWQRNKTNDGWLHISDNNYTYYQNFINDLKDVYFFILKKFIIKC